MYSTLFREQDKAYINSLQWSTLVGLTCVPVHVSCSTTVLGAFTMDEVDLTVAPVNKKKM